MNSRHQYQYSHLVENSEPETLGVDDEITEEITTETQTHDIKEAIIKCGCMLYFVIGFSLSIAILSQEIDLIQIHGKDFVLLFSFLIILFYIINMLLIFYVRYETTSKITCKIQFALRIKKNLLLYIIALPLVIVVIVRLLIQSFYLLRFPYATTSITLSVTVTYIFFLISVFLLMVNNEKIEIVKQYHRFSLINKASVMFTCVGIIVSVIIYSTRQGMQVFKTYSPSYYNVTYYYNGSAPYSQNKKLYDSLISIQNVLEPIHISFLIICISYLLTSLMIDNKNNEIESNLNSIVIKKRNWRNIILGLVIGISLIILNITSLALILQKEKYSMYEIYFYVIMCVLHGISIVLSVLQIKEIKRWKKTYRNQNIILNKFLMMIGSFGSIIFIINNVSISLHKIADLHGNDNKYRITIITESLSLIALVFLTFQVTLQSIIVHLTLLTTPEYPLPNSMAQRFCPSMVLFCMNIGTLLISIYMASIGFIAEFKIISFNLFHHGIHIFSTSLTIVYRLHGCLFFGILWNKVHK